MKPHFIKYFHKLLIFFIKDVELTDFGDEDTMQPGTVYNNSLKY